MIDWRQNWNLKTFQFILEMKIIATFYFVVTFEKGGIIFSICCADLTLVVRE